jgi:hypothetical protein
LKICPHELDFRIDYTCNFFASSILAIIIVNNKSTSAYGSENGLNGEKKNRVLAHNTPIFASIVSFHASVYEYFIPNALDKSIVPSAKIERSSTTDIAPIK